MSASTASSPPARAERSCSSPIPAAAKESRYFSMSSSERSPSSVRPLSRGAEDESPRFAESCARATTAVRYESLIYLVLASADQSGRAGRLCGGVVHRPRARTSSIYTIPLNPERGRELCFLHAPNRIFLVTSCAWQPDVGPRPPLSLRGCSRRHARQGRSRARWACRPSSDGSR